MIDGKLNKLGADADYILLSRRTTTQIFAQHTSLRKERGGPPPRKVVVKTQNKASKYLYIKFSLAERWRVPKNDYKTN